MGGTKQIHTLKIRQLWHKPKGRKGKTAAGVDCPKSYADVVHVNAECVKCSSREGLTFNEVLCSYEPDSELTEELPKRRQ